jgi:hypothetical protein
LATIVCIDTGRQTGLDGEEHHDDHGRWGSYFSKTKIASSSSMVNRIVNCDHKLVTSMNAAGSKNLLSVCNQLIF